MLLLPYSSHPISQLTLWRWKLCHYYVTKCKVLACTRRWHQTQSLFIELGWNLYGRIFLRRANDTVMDGNLALLRTLLTPNVWDFTSSNSLQTPAGCATIPFWPYLPGDSIRPHRLRAQPHKMHPPPHFTPQLQVQVVICASEQSEVRRTRS